jgi:hypothetical protein
LTHLRWSRQNRRLCRTSLQNTTSRINTQKKKKKSLPWSVSELYRPGDRRLSVKLVPMFADSGCRVVSAMDRHGHIIVFLYRSRCYFFQVAPQLYSRGWVDPPPDFQDAFKKWQKRWEQCTRADWDWWWPVGPELVFDQQAYGRRVLSVQQHLWYGDLGCHHVLKYNLVTF